LSLLEHRPPLAKIFIAAGLATMAQSYFPIRVASPMKEAFHDSVFADLNGDKQLKVEDVQEAYIESKDRCVAVFKSLLLATADIRADWSPPSI
jgi:hypothetical protein